MYWRFLYEQNKVSYTYLWDTCGKHTTKESNSMVSTVERNRAGLRLPGVIGISLHIRGTVKRPVEVKGK